MQHEIFSNICSFVCNVNSSLRSSSIPPHIKLISEEALPSKLEFKNDEDRARQTPIILIQHKPAHLEQLILRISNTPHILQNSFYMFNETTGPYPCLCDLTHSNGALVGRNHPSSPSKVSDHHYHDCQSDIISYLRIVHNIDLDKSINATTDANDDNVIDNTKTSQRSFIQTLLSQKLGPILLYFQSRNTYQRSKIDRVKNIFLNPLDTFQSFAIYHSTCRTIPSFIENEEMALKMAKDAYHCLNVVLQPVDKSSDVNLSCQQKVTLLKTEEYTNIDCLLYAHLCEALLEPSLFFILRQCTNILLFYKAIRATYFEHDEGILSIASSTNIGQKDDWKVQNDIINQQNQYYYHLPISLLFNSAVENSTEEDVCKERDLDILQAALKSKRKRRYTHGRSIQNLRFYGSLHPPDKEELEERMFWNFKSDKNDSKGKNENSDYNMHHKEIMKREQQKRKHQDMLWLGGMFGMVSFAYYWGN